MKHRHHSQCNSLYKTIIVYFGDKEVARVWNEIDYMAWTTKIGGQLAKQKIYYSTLTKQLEDIKWAKKKYTIEDI